MKVAIYTLGCKVNQYETQILKDLFLRNGFELTASSDDAHIFVVNSCAVTQFAERKSKQLIRRYKKFNPHSIAVLTGCCAQAFDQLKEDLPEADVITGTHDRQNLVELVNQTIKSKEKVRSITPPHHEFESMQTKNFDSRTRALVKIEDGCNRGCSYCIIPKARGPVRSKPIEEIKQELQNLSKNGYKEAVLVGINLCSYGKDLKDTRLIDAIEAACQVEGIARIRLGSLEPDMITEDDLIRMSKLPKLCDHFHLSLQSGCDDTLKRMNRRYTSSEYADLLKQVRKYFPNAGITTDVMVGFAGESKPEFAKSIHFVHDMEFNQVHVFPYSVRPGTKAADFPDQVISHSKKMRVEHMRRTASVCQKAFYRTQRGKTCQVLFETFEAGFLYGYSKNYIPVYAIGDPTLCGEICNVRLEKYAESGYDSKYLGTIFKHIE